MKTCCICGTNLVDYVPETYKRDFSILARYIDDEYYCLEDAKSLVLNSHVPLTKRITLEDEKESLKTVLVEL